MTDMTTIKTTLQTLTKILDPFGADVFPEPEVEISIEIPSWLLSTLGDELSGVTLIRTKDDRFVAGIALGLARAAVAALNSDPSLDDLIRLMERHDRQPDLYCNHWDADDTAEDRECITLEHWPSGVSFTIYVDGIGDRIYGREA